MTANKTTYTNASVNEFIQTVTDVQKQRDSVELIKLMQTISAEPPQMFGPSIVGFGTYHYKYTSGHTGHAPLIGFSPRKTAISLYVYTGLEDHKYLLEQLGKFKMGKACIYIKRLSDINIEKLNLMMHETISFIENTYTRIKK